MHAQRQDSDMRAPSSKQRQKKQKQELYHHQPYVTFEEDPR